MKRREWVVTLAAAGLMLVAGCSTADSSDQTGSSSVSTVSPAPAGGEVPAANGAVLPAGNGATVGAVDVRARALGTNDVPLNRIDPGEGFVSMRVGPRQDVSALIVGPPGDAGYQGVGLGVGTVKENPIGQQLVAPRQEPLPMVVPPEGDRVPTLNAGKRNLEL
jgi:hypothetical protein